MSILITVIIRENFQKDAASVPEPQHGQVAHPFVSPLHSSGGPGHHLRLVALRKAEFPKPPLGLRPEATAIQDRIREIEQACDGYRRAYPAVALVCEVPSAWTAELNRLKDRLEQLRLEKESEVGK